MRLRRGFCGPELSPSGTTAVFLLNPSVRMSDSLNTGSMCPPSTRQLNMTEQSQPISKRRKISRARLILPIAGAGLLMACSYILISSSREKYSEAAVLRTIHEVVLHKSQRPGVADGGLIGPWWISASRVDPISGTLYDFSLASGQMVIAAKYADLEIDAYEDTFSFNLHGVVLTRIPGEFEDVGEAFLIEYEQYLLGPAPFGADIIPDAGTAPRRNNDERDRPPSPLAGVPISDE